MSRISSCKTEIKNALHYVAIILVLTSFSQSFKTEKKSFAPNSDLAKLRINPDAKVEDAILVLDLFK